MPHVSPGAARPSPCPGPTPGVQMRRLPAELPPKIGLEMQRNATHPSNFHHQQRGLILSTIYFKGLKSAATSGSQASASTPFPKPAPRAGGATRLSPHLHPLSPHGEARVVPGLSALANPTDTQKKGKDKAGGERSPSAPNRPSGHALRSLTVHHKKMHP